jgi:hypothetical protein
MIAKGNVKKGIEWRFGSNWPGERCGAKPEKEQIASAPPIRRMDDVDCTVGQVRALKHFLDVQ